MDGIDFITFFGFIVSITSAIATLYVIFMKMFGMPIPGWSAITAPLYFLGGCQILMLGVVGEYIGRIYEESKNRPRFIVENKTNQDQD